MTTDTAAKKVFIKTFGCQMNVYDSERMSEALAADGYCETTELEDADLVLLDMDRDDYRWLKLQPSTLRRAF